MKKNKKKRSENLKMRDINHDATMNEKSPKEEEEEKKL